MEEETKEKGHVGFGRWLNEGKKSFKYGFIAAALGFVSTCGAIIYEGVYLEEPTRIVRTYYETKKALDNLQLIKENFKFQEGRLSDLNKTIESLERYVSKTKDNPEVLEYKENKERVERNSEIFLLSGIGLVTMGVASMGLGLLNEDEEK